MIELNDEISEFELGNFDSKPSELVSFDSTQN
jgi:hypothetical protein